MCWQQWTPLQRHYIPEVNIVIKMLWDKVKFSNTHRKMWDLNLAFSFCQPKLHNLTFPLCQPKLHYKTNIARQWDLNTARNCTLHPVGSNGRSPIEARRTTAHGNPVPTRPPLVQTVRAVFLLAANVYFQ
jgi:hypothetical protein